MNRKWLKYGAAAGAIILIGISLFIYFGNSKYAAKVNDTYITKEQLDKSAAIRIKYYETTARKLTDGEKTALKKETLDSLIINEILVQEAKKRNIVITDAQINNYLKSVKKDINDKQFKNLIGDQAYNEQNFRERTKNKLLYRALKDAVTGGISDPLKKYEAFNKFIDEAKKNAAIKIYMKFNYELK